MMLDVFLRRLRTAKPGQLIVVAVLALLFVIAAVSITGFPWLRGLLAVAALALFGVLLYAGVFASGSRVESAAEARTLELERIRESLKAEIARLRETQNQQNSKLEMQQAILDNTPSVIFVKDTEGRYLLVNNRYKALFGVNHENIVGLTDHEIFPTEFADNFCSNDQQVFASGQPLEFEEHVPQPDGNHIYLSVKFPLLNTDGKPRAVCGIATDITSYKQQEHALRASEARLLLAQHIARLGNWELDIATGSLHCSEEIYSIIGRRPRIFGTADETFLLDTVFSEDRDLVEQRIGNALQEGGSFSIDYRILHSDGGIRFVRMQAQAFRDKEDEAVRLSGTIQDITEQKQAEEAMITSQAALRRLDETRRQRDILVREVHHRIKNHLQGIVGLLTNQIMQHPEASELLETAIGQINSIALVHGLQGKRTGEKVDLYLLMNAICRSIAQVSGVEIDLEETPTSKTPRHMEGDEAVPVSMILNELLQNAIKHLRPSGDGPPVSVESEDNGEEVLIRIVNQGAPLPEEFDLEMGRGIGTGLELVKSLLPHEGARLSVRSEEDLVVTELALWPPAITG